MDLLQSLLGFWWAIPVLLLLALLLLWKVLLRVVLGAIIVPSGKIAASSLTAEGSAVSFNRTP
jgi:hypothetical protein